MEKKIDKANEHICILIDELVELKVSRYSLFNLSSSL